MEIVVGKKPFLCLTLHGRLAVKGRAPDTSKDPLSLPLLLPFLLAIHKVASSKVTPIFGST